MKQGTIDAQSTWNIKCPTTTNENSFPDKDGCRQRASFITLKFMAAREGEKIMFMNESLPIAHGRVRVTFSFVRRLNARSAIKNTEVLERLWRPWKSQIRVAITHLESSSKRSKSRRGLELSSWSSSWNRSRSLRLSLKCLHRAYLLGMPEWKRAERQKCTLVELCQTRVGMQKQFDWSIDKKCA